MKDGRLRLYSVATSSASHRVRIALGLKAVPYEYVAVPLFAQDSEEFAAYRALNPQGLVPALVHGGAVITQSLAIIEYLDETVRSPPLLPADALGRARVRALAQAVVSEIQPLQNLRVERHLRTALGHSEADGLAWRRHWINVGLAALERMLQASATASFCHGDTPTIADCCLVPQVFAARRWGVDLAPFPTVAAIAERAGTLQAFRDAEPQRQPDAR